jgi:hypothetical protein
MRKLKTALAVLAGAVMAGTAFAADSITVPTDPKARYWATEVKRKGDLVVITTFRKGPSDISTAKRLVDCKAKRFKPRDGRCPRSRRRVRALSHRVHIGLRCGVCLLKSPMTPRCPVAIRWQLGCSSRFVAFKNVGKDGRSGEI